MLLPCALCIYTALSLADLASTEWGISRGAREIHPLGQSTVERILLKAGSTAAFTFADSQLTPKPRKVFRILIIGIISGVVIHNIKEGFE